LTFATETPVLIAPPRITGQYDSSASVTSVALFADCPRRYYLSRYLGWDGARSRPFREEEDGEPDRDPVDSTDFGRQVHALLGGGARDAGNSEANSEALALAARFESSDVGRRLGSTTRIEREFDFLLAVDDVALVGQIDLWFEESGTLVLVDYKTDEVSAAEVPARAGAYTLQLQLYALALERLTGRAPDSALLYFLRPDIAVPVGVTDAERRQAAVTVRGFQQSQNDQHFPLREGAHCHRCPFFKGMCPAVVPLTLN
jgi:CRISPR/Cas system-associated exonuclease Cas4 (RecB family)